ncbi:hypothetical protein HP572_22875 (plasmid) [Pectobacterium sp. PL64]|uniref:hypothetical protein n=1 Tax=Pectobacterium sp. PL64 TaxID=2738983 RepID=UPI001F0C5CCC|nr:hypothetical protein [Pectobacterium sp. PL64]UMO90286.1 hypothetical protein HP572_22875 [Pectobacterium sp. PL64]
MAEKILFVFEGEKTEHVISRDFIRHFIHDDEKTIVKVSFCAEIYQLYVKIKEDDFGVDYVDIFPLLQERDHSLKSYKRDEFSQVYLFFDYDPHATNSSNDKLHEMLNVFSEETDKGKLFVSYPMVESIRCFNGIDDDFINLVIPKDDVGGFKKFVNEYADKKYNNVPQWTKDTWIKVIEIHCRKANSIVFGVNDLPSHDIGQCLILDKQCEIEETSSSVIVISSFPLMLLSHFGENMKTILAESTPD